MTAGIEEQLVEPGCAPPAWTAQGSKPLGDDDGRAGTAAHRRVDRGFQPYSRDPGAGEIDDRAGRRRAPEAVHRDHVGRSERVRGVDDERNLSTASDSRHRELDDVGPTPVEGVETGGSLVADGSGRPEAQQAAHLNAVDRVRRPSDGEDAWCDLDEPSIGEYRPAAMASHAQCQQLGGRDHPVLPGG